jgi:hypothetical protein
MKELYEFISAVITARLPEIKAVAMWNSQTTRERLTKTEKAFRTPAVFIEFIVDDEVQNLSLGIKNVPLRIRFRFALQGYKFQRLEDLTFKDNFDAVIQGLRGNETDPVQFSSLQEAMTEVDEDHDQVNEPYIDYMTIWRKQTAYRRKTDIFVPGIQPELAAVLGPKSNQFVFSEGEGSTPFTYDESESENTYFYNDNE